MSERKKGIEGVRKCYRPTGGWVMRMRKGYCIGQVWPTSGLSQSVMGCSGHMRSLGSCLWLRVVSIVQKRNEGEEDRRKKNSQFETCIVTIIPRVSQMGPCHRSKT